QAWQVDTGEEAVTVSACGDDNGDGLSVVRAVASAAWKADFDGRTFTIEAGDDVACHTLQRWSVL
ncbi:MAG TPA: HAD family hydrolase, partial [Mycobacterium sp.]|nr:HAD family hydrolase [Mycobacterium sp.]